MAIRLLLAAVLAAGCCAAAGALLPPQIQLGHIANADDYGLGALGKRTYLARCASCHGRALQGQALWQIEDQDSARRAPALDRTGRAWQHADEDIFHAIKSGAFASAPASHGAISAFAPGLSDREILAVMAYIKASWPIGLRVAQAKRNPGSAGMPAAATTTWSFPPYCALPSQ